MSLLDQEKQAEQANNRNAKEKCKFDSAKSEAQSDDSKKASSHKPA